LQSNLDIFITFNNNYNNFYKNKISETIPFYSVKTNLVKTANQLVEQINILQSLCNEYKITEEGNSDTKIVTLYNEIQNKKNTLDTLNYLIAQLGSEYDVVNQVKNIRPTNLILINKIQYTGTPERNCYFTLNSNIDTYNNIINTLYITYLNSLDQVLSEESTARSIMNFFRDFISSVKIDNLTKTYFGINIECYKYTGLIKTIEKRIDSSAEQTDTYSYSLVLENIINPILDNLSWYISFTRNGGYSSIINQLQIKANSYENKVNELINLKNVLIEMQGYTNPIAHYKPILFLYNRYELDFINNWDGNKLELGDGYLIAPQMGAGIKDSVNRFTGIVMGVKQVKEGTRGDIGLFGYNEGIQSIFLNAKTGSATFGQRGEGQIIFEPSAKQAIIKSGNYNDGNKEIYVRVYPNGGNPAELAYFEYVYDPTQEKYDYILSTDTHVNSNKAYYQKTSEKAGMLIDLSTPEIKFGTGNFKVTKEGHITAKGGGEIAGWTINDTQIFKNKIYIDSGTVKEKDDGTTYTTFGFYGSPFSASGIHDTLDSTAKGFYLGTDGLSIVGSYSEYVYGQHYTRTSKFQINTNGNPKIFSGGHETLDSKLKGFYLGQDGFSISNGSRSRFEISTEGDPKLFSSNHNSLNSQSDGFYLGNDGMSIGSKIYIDKTGLMRIGYGATYEDSDYRRCWTIDGSSYRSSISYGTPGESGSVYIGTDKITLGSKFSVDNQGNLKASEVDLSGKITATSGEIAGWKISTNTLSSADGKIKLNSGGNSKFVEGPNGYIDLEGGIGTDGTDFTGCHINAKNVCFSAEKIWTTRSRGATSLYEGQDYEIRFWPNNEYQIRLKWINGLLIEHEVIHDG